MDGIITFMNINLNSSISFFSIDNKWIMYTSDGYFDSSRNGGELVTMVKGTDVFGVDQFAIRNNRPDIILKRLGLGSEELINHFYGKENAVKYAEECVADWMKKRGLKKEDLTKEMKK